VYLAFVSGWGKKLTLWPVEEACARDKKKEFSNCLH